MAKRKRSVCTACKGAGNYYRDMGPAVVSCEACLGSGLPRLPPPAESFQSERGRGFTLHSGTRWERWPEDPLWDETFPILYEGEDAGKLYRSESYGRTAAGLPKWHASITQLRWRIVSPSDLPMGHGYDVAAFDTAEECLHAWGRSADQILDYLTRRIDVDPTAGGGRQ